MDQQPNIDGIKLDLTNEEFFNYARLILEDPPRRVIFLTGKAGTGKSTFLKYIINKLNQDNEKSEIQRPYVVLAPTGVAAVNVHGQTIHSFFKLPLGAFLPQDEKYKLSNIKKCFSYNNDKIELIKHLSLMIIDEISMVRCDVLDIIDKILRVYRKDERPFGGVKVLLIGDIFQLPPIASTKIYDKDLDAWVPIKSLLMRQGYKSVHFFDSDTYINSNPYRLELKKPYRQKEEVFIQLLDKARINKLDPNDIVMLNTRHCKPTELAQEDIIHLAPLNSIVDAYNQQQYDALEGDEKEYHASIQGDFPEKIMPVQNLIKLKIGTQVMICRNHFDNDGDLLKTYYNGTIGKIERLDDECIYIKSKNPLTNEDVRYVIEKCTWENIEYTWNRETKLMEETVLGSFTQFPIKTAWAITIHKSQGLTFDHVMLSLRDCFAPGQVYVALSRCRKLNGIFLSNPISDNIFKDDPRVIEEIKKVDPDYDIKTTLKNMDADKYYALARKAIMHNRPNEILKYYNEARKYRDDYDTAPFNKYIAHIAQLLHDYKEHRNSLLNEKLARLNEIEKLKKDIELLDDTYQKISQQYNEVRNESINLQKNNSCQQQIIATQDKKISTLEQLITKNEIEKAGLASKIDEYKEIILKNEASIENKQNDIITLSIQNSKMQGQNNLLKDELEKTRQELSRVQQIKWWQKLFGKK